MGPSTKSAYLGPFWAILEVQGLDLGPFWRVWGWIWVYFERSEAGFGSILRSRVGGGPGLYIVKVLVLRLTSSSLLFLDVTRLHLVMHIHLLSLH